MGHWHNMSVNKGQTAQQIINGNKIKSVKKEKEH